MATPLGIFRGSSLNLEWSKRGIQLDDQRMLISRLHIEDYFDACLDVTFIWDFDMLDYWWLILLHCLAYWFWFWHDGSNHFTCIHSPQYITQLDMPIIIDCSSCFAWYSDSVSSWLFCSLHMHRLTIVHRLTCCVIFSGLYILLIVFGHGVLITIHPDCHGLYVYMSDISCTLPDCMLHDYPSSAWLHVACSCGSHFYPLTSKSLGFGHSFHPSSHYCKCETFCVLALWPS